MDCIKGMKKLPENSINLIVTSPPYNVGKDYEIFKDKLSSIEYEKFILNCFTHFKRILKRDGRLAINVGNWIPCVNSFSPLWYGRLMKRAGLKLKYVITWVKSSKPGNPQSFCGMNCAWGSWLSASSPSIRSYSEAILIGCNQQFEREKKGSDMTKKEFMEYTKNVWYFPVEVKMRRFHPCPFPEELAKRCIKLLSFKDDLVLDPFIGTGTTAVVAKKLKRRFIGFEINERYVKTANKRLKSTKRGKT
jgi:DNA modification methylase